MASRGRSQLAQCEYAAGTIDVGLVIDAMPGGGACGWDERPQLVVAVQVSTVSLVARPAHRLSRPDLLVGPCFVGSSSRAAYGGLLIMRGLKSFPVLFTAH
jgi:hypothetical protein